MSSDVDICNSALALLGDDATVASINPPEGSIQAQHCATFYPRARRQMLELADWSFASRRVALALLAETPPQSYAYAYAMPADCINILGVLDPVAPDDYSAALAVYVPNAGIPSPMVGVTGLGIVQANVGVYTSQDYTQEIDANGVDVLYTNQQGAILRYIADVTDSTQFSPLFEEGLVMLLAAKLAGPIIKGSEGRAVAKEWLEEWKWWLDQAATSDAGNKRHTTAQSTTWLVNR